MLPTKPGGTPRRFHTIAGSPEGVAELARGAALVFLDGTGWGRRELASWLVGPYTRATSCVPTTMAARRDVSPFHRPVTEQSVVDLAARTRQQIVEIFGEAATTWGTASFARGMLDSGIVVGVVDSNQRLGFAPVAQAGMRLVHRVASLIVADYLTRPADYQTVSLCAECGEMSFPWARGHASNCDGPGPHSGVRSGFTGAHDVTPTPAHRDATGTGR